jgi:hypothetical protein
MKLIKKMFSSETTEPISTKFWWNDPCVVPFQNCVRYFRSPTNMATTAELNLHAILVESRDNRIHCWKGAIQSLVAISPVVSEEKIVM